MKSDLPSEVIRALPRIDHLSLLEGDWLEGVLKSIEPYKPQITDIGFDLVRRRAEIVAQYPNGRRVEFTVKVLEMGNNA